MVVQSLDSIVHSVKPNAFLYSAGLIATQKRKSCVEMSKQLSVSHDKLYRALNVDQEAIIALKSILSAMVKRCSALEKGWLIIDDTLVAKMFAKLIPGLDYHVDSSTGNYTKGLCILAIAWTNGELTIPLDFRFWFSKKILPEGYKTKIKLAQDLLFEHAPNLNVDKVLLDGLYASQSMMRFLNNNDIKFEMRMASNRVVTTDNDKRVKLRNLKSLNPQRNARSRTQKVLWNGIEVYITSDIRYNKRGEKSKVFLVSNYLAHSKEHVAAYKLRWNIEMIFRTSKQSLGLEECSSRNLQKQAIHICFVFVTYAYLQSQRILSKSKNVEEVIKALQASKHTTRIRLIRRLEQFFAGYA